MAERDREHTNKLKDLMAKKMKASFLRGPTHVNIVEEEDDDPFAAADARADEERAVARRNLVLEHTEEMGVTDAFEKQEAAMIAKVDEANLDDAQQKMLLQQINDGMGSLDGLLAAERKRQEGDLDAMMRERLARRRKRAGQQNKQAIKEEMKEKEKGIASMIQARL